MEPPARERERGNNQGEENLKHKAWAGKLSHRWWTQAVGRCRAEDISHSWEQQAPQKVFGLSLYVQCRRTKGNKGADTEEARRAREVWLTAS